MKLEFRFLLRLSLTLTIQLFPLKPHHVFPPFPPTTGALTRTDRSVANVRWAIGWIPPANSAWIRTSAPRNPASAATAPATTSSAVSSATARRDSLPAPTEDALTWMNATKLRAPNALSGEHQEKE